ncbi:MAG: MBL fold metallo-hydrolase [Candidatus Korarchaeota archaeon]|nr:MBL fold metallo-hydrolase [Candidatus Korarchaeota archaeon]NIU82406.1 MBL fold metallo-hydrolase [Candidatus Thorarchaeota archaeon]NIW12879.1 MBL fold metallo-hydrolase [Candidatus Thorarchaeota archaeon]NIW51073.1 MBL fold metallo-hydrolase [Candidatus Korarchaeota archaeon]
MKLSKHCYCLTGLCHSDCFSVNAGFITGMSETIIIDSGFNIESAQTIYHYAKTAAPDNEITTLINLERHYDHIFGNGYFINKGVKVIAHEKVKLTEEEIAEFKHKSNEEIVFERRKRNKEAYIFFDNVKAFEPDVRISEDTDFEIDGLKIKIILAPGHTITNLMVYVEKDRVLYAGDTIYAEYLPTLRFGNEKLWNEWLTTLDTIERLKTEILAPGHGKILEKEEIQREINRHREILKKRITVRR